MLAGRKIDDDGLHRADRFLTSIRSGSLVMATRAA
jgi:hypothetical protein